VRIEVEIPADQVLLSAYGAWHYVLNRWYLPHAVEPAAYEAEGDDWRSRLEQAGVAARWPYPEPWHSEVVASWQRIFDVDELRATNTIQGCFEKLRLCDVVEVKAF